LNREPALWKKWKPGKILPRRNLRRGDGHAGLGCKPRPPAIIPAPQKMEVRNGAFHLTPGARIYVANAAARLSQFPKPIRSSKRTNPTLMVLASNMARCDRRHDLDRCRTQFKLVESIEQQETHETTGGRIIE
jgi:hypothetical protein